MATTRNAVQAPARLQVVLSCHQSLTRSESELERLWDTCYAPLVGRVAASDLKVSLHITGHLLDHLTRRREDALLEIKRLTACKRLEVLGGLFYGGLPALLPELDVRGQVQMMAEYWESVLGYAPAGFFLPESAWCPELPRLLQETGLSYGFASLAQITQPLPDHLGIGVVERAEQRLTAFLIDPSLSNAMVTRPVEEWIDAATDRLASRPGGLVTVHLPAERFFPDDSLIEIGWLERWLSALPQAHPEIVTTLPFESVTTVRPAIPVKPRERSPEADGGDDGADWTDLVRASPATDGLYRRMLRASDKLREAIATMEDEELDASWSDSLATAQRLLFSAQAYEAYQPRRQDAAKLRDAAIGRLVRAEAMIDALVQGEEDWLATEEEDVDGDLLEEVFVCNRYLTAWLAPALGGALRAVDDRQNAWSVLAPKDASVPGAIAIGREAVLDERANLAELLSASAVDLLGAKTRWDMIENRIDEEGDCAFHMRLGAAVDLAGISPRQLQVTKTVTIPIDAAELRLDYELALTGAPEVVFVTGLPLRLPSPINRVLIDGEEVQGEQLERVDASSVRLETAEGRAFAVRFEAPSELWLARAGADCVNLFFVARVDGKVELEVVVNLLGEEAAPDDAISDADLETSDLAADEGEALDEEAAEEEEELEVGTAEEEEEEEGEDAEDEAAEDEAAEDEAAEDEAAEDEAAEGEGAEEELDDEEAEGEGAEEELDEEAKGEGAEEELDDEEGDDDFDLGDEEDQATEEDEEAEEEERDDATVVDHVDAPSVGLEPDDSEDERGSKSSRKS